MDVRLRTAAGIHIDNVGVVGVLKLSVQCETFAIAASHRGSIRSFLDSVHIAHCSFAEGVDGQRSGCRSSGCACSASVVHNAKLRRGRTLNANRFLSGTSRVGWISLGGAVPEAFIARRA
jgi:hypothetical protein